MKITVDELNQAYNEANKFKINGYPVRTSLEIEVDRNPLVDYNDNGAEYTTPIKLKFELDNNLGKKGSYVLSSKNVDIIHTDED